MLKKNHRKIRVFFHILCTKVISRISICAAAGLNIHTKEMT